MPSAPRVRRAVPPDLPFIRDLLIGTWHATYDAILGSDAVDDICARWHSLATLTLQISAPGVAFLVAESGPPPRIVGTALAGPAGGDHECLELRRLYVRPDSQGQGVGRSLLAGVIDLHPAARLVRLEVEPRNTGAIRFYARQGFALAGEIASCGDDPRLPRAVIMERALDRVGGPAA